jgi:hypothetical protein
LRWLGFEVEVDAALFASLFFSSFKPSQQYPT